MEAFNNREIALLIWGVIGIVAAYIYFKDSLFEITLSVFDHLFVSLYIIFLSYCFLCILALKSIGLWSHVLLKDTILWLLFVGFITIFKLHKVSENKNYFRDAALDNFKLSILLDFITSLYPFSLVIELAIVPIMVLVALILAVSETKPELDQLKKIVTLLIAAYSIFLVGHSIYYIKVNFIEFVTISTLQSFLLQPLLALLFIPLIYCISTYMAYETTFIVLKRHVPSHLFTNAKKQATLNFKLNYHALIKWRADLLKKESINTIDDITSSIKEIKRRQKIERNPPSVSFDNGWSPFAAKDFLVDEGISTGYYNHKWGNEWSAMSTYIRLDDSVITNNVVYYVYGNELAATKLCLELNMNSPDNSIQPHMAFAKYSQTLLEKAINKQLPDNIEDALFFDENCVVQMGQVQLSVIKTNWESLNMAYSLKFEIKHQQDRSSFSY